jgi:hypothetical protein
MKARLTEHVARIGKMRNSYNFLVGKPGGKGPLERLKRRGEGNIRMDLKETGWQSVDWIHLAQEKDQWRALVNKVINVRVRRNAGNFLLTGVSE